MKIKDIRIKMYKGYAVEVRENHEEYDTAFVYGDIAFVYGGRLVCNLSTRCIGTKSINRSMQYHTRVMKRIMYLIEQMDMTQHSIACYSSNLLMTKPKNGFEDKWEEYNNKYNMLVDWFNDILDGMNEHTRTALKNEFDEYNIITNSHTITIHDEDTYTKIIYQMMCHGIKYTEENPGNGTVQINMICNNEEYEYLLATVEIG